MCTAPCAGPKRNAAGRALERQVIADDCSVDDKSERAGEAGAAGLATQLRRAAADDKRF